MEKKKLEDMTMEELQKEYDSIENEIGKMKEELNSTVSTMNEKINQARSEFDQELDKQAQVLEQSIKDYREAIVELRSTKDSEFSNVKSMTSKNVEFIGELITILGVSSMDEIPTEINRLLQLQADYNKLQEQLQVQGMSNVNAQNIREKAIISKLNKLLKIWDPKNLALSQDSPLIPMFDVLNDWVALMTQPDFNQHAMDEVVRDLYNIFNKLAESK